MYTTTELTNHIPHVWAALLFEVCEWVLLIIKGGCFFELIIELDYINFTTELPKLLCYNNIIIIV